MGAVDLLTSSRWTVFDIISQPDDAGNALDAFHFGDQPGYL